MTCGPHMVPRRYSTPALTAQRSTFKSVEIGNRVAAAAYLVAGSGSPCLRGQSHACRWGQAGVSRPWLCGANLRMGNQVGALSAPDGVPAGLRKRLSVTLTIAG